jgi:hypothetical protein
MNVTKIIHGLLIDAVARKVTVVGINPNDQLRSAYRHIGCDMIEAAVRLPNGDVLYVDEEALVKRDKPKGSFMFAGQVFVGNGLIVNEMGDDWTAPMSPIAQIIHSIEFPPGIAEPPFDCAEILAAMVTGQFHVMTRQDYEPFLGAQLGSVICYDLKGWTVIVSPGKHDEEAISAHAYYFPDPEFQGPEDESYWMLNTNGWNIL